MLLHAETKRFDVQEMVVNLKIHFFPVGTKISRIIGSKQYYWFKALLSGSMKKAYSTAVSAFEVP